MQRNYFFGYGSFCDAALALKVYGYLFPENKQPGTYTITFTGVSGSLTNTATAKFTVK